MNTSRTNIIRQHESTTLVELVGKVCEDFVGVYDRVGDRYEVFYMKMEGVSHRFFLDAGLLFWRSHQSYDPDNDLFDGGEYVNLGLQGGVVGEKVKSISMEDSVLTLEFENGASMIFGNDVQGSGAKQITHGD